jgi:hypothetical protein
MSWKSLRTVLSGPTGSITLSSKERSNIACSSIPGTHHFLNHLHEQNP